MIPLFQIAVRNEDGHPSLLRVQHEEITSIEQAVDLVRGEIPNAKVILIAVPKEIMDVGRPHLKIVA